MSTTALFLLVVDCKMSTVRAEIFTEMRVDRLLLCRDHPGLFSAIVSRIAATEGVVWWSVCLSVFWSRSCALHNQLNRSRCRFGIWLAWAQWTIH